MLLNEGFNNDTNKICLLSVKSMIWWDTCLVNSCDSITWWKDHNIARNFAEERRVHFSTKAKMTCLKELPGLDLQSQAMHSLTPKWDDVQEATLLILGPKINPKRCGLYMSVYGNNNDNNSNYIIIINNYSLKSRWMVAEYLPSHGTVRWIFCHNSPWFLWITIFIVYIPTKWSQQHSISMFAEFKVN